MSSANFVATLGKHEHSSAEQQAGVYRTHVIEAESRAEDFVLVSAPPEPDAHSSDD